MARAPHGKFEPILLPSVKYRMIIPIRCMNCGKHLADKWRFYQDQLKKMKGDEERVYFDGSSIPETAEKKILDAMDIKRSCCRKHFLTQVDLIDKI